VGENDHEQTASSGTGVDASLARHGGLSYLEIPAIDPRQSAAFYEKVVGWNVRGDDPTDPLAAI
jgi:predicted enzyme related to lactoylglutathione lyase